MSDQITVNHDEGGNLTHIYIPKGTFTYEEVVKIIEENKVTSQNTSEIRIVGDFDHDIDFVEQQINLSRWNHCDVEIFGINKNNGPAKNKPYYRQFDKKNRY